MKFRVLLLLALFLAAIPAIPLQAQQGLLLLEKGSVKVIGPERTRLLRKPVTKLVLRAKDRVQTGIDTSVKIKIRGKPEIIELKRGKNKIAYSILTLQCINIFNID